MGGMVSNPADLRFWMFSPFRPFQGEGKCYRWWSYGGSPFLALALLAEGLADPVGAVPGVGRVDGDEAVDAAGKNGRYADFEDF